MKTFDLAGPAKIGGELDIEASFREGDIIYWLGSHGNNKSGAEEVSRETVIATRVSGQGADTSLAYVAKFQSLRTDLIAWDQANGNRFQLAAAAAEGVQPKAALGFNIEGAELAPDGRTAYIGMRAPLYPPQDGGKAIILTVTNWDAIMDGSAEHATFGAPILVDLGGLSVREIRRNAQGDYLILAGSYAGGTGQALYTWDGEPGHPPIRTSTAIPASAELYSDEPPAWEGIVDVPHPVVNGDDVQLIMDQGYADLYHEGGEAKSIGAARTKARTDHVTLAGVTSTAYADAPVAGTVPATLALALGAPASFGTFTPGVDRTYTASTTADVVSTAGDASLAVSDPGHLANGAFSLPEPLRLSLSRSSWPGPVSHDAVAVTATQHIGATDALRSGGYERTLTFTLSTTTP